MIAHRKYILQIVLHSKIGKKVKHLFMQRVFFLNFLKHSGC